MRASLLCRRIFSGAQRLQKRSLSFSWPAPRRLENFVHLDKLQNLEAEQVAELWRAYPKNAEAAGKLAVTAAWTTKLYTIIAERRKQCPMMVLPVFRDDCQNDKIQCSEHAQLPYWAAVIQWQGDHLMVTSLEVFKLASSDAAPTAVYTLYDELKMAKQHLVLVRGDVIGVQDLPRDAAILFLQMIQRFYSNQQLYEKYVYTFNHDQSKFSFHDLLLDASNIFQQLQTRVDGPLIEIE